MTRGNLIRKLMGKLTIPGTDKKERQHRNHKAEEERKHCEDLGLALNKDRNIGETVEKVQKLIFT